MKNYRLESDSVGELKIPTEAYYGVQSLRGKNNFPITGQTMHPLQIQSLAEIKKASALCNHQVGLLEEKVKNAIVSACDEIIDGNLLEEFIIDPIQGGAGTSANMNANEVIANRANELIGGEKGEYNYVHPNDHVNMSQSTNDVYPTSGKLTTLKLIDQLSDALEALVGALETKEKEFDAVIKMGRTQMQDAVPIRLGQSFSAFAAAGKRDLQRLEAIRAELYPINMGGTAVGTGINASESYIKGIAEEVARVSGYPVKKADNLVDATQNLDCYVAVSGVLKTLAVGLSKMSNDLRLLSSGPRTGIFEITLPPMQNGSSIMPGKVNPVIPEVVSQVAFLVAGNDVTITMAAEGGQLELNAFEPVLFYSLFESIETLTQGIITLHHNCIEGISANEEHARALVENSIGIITAVTPALGYKRAAEIAKEAMETGRPIRELLVQSGELTVAEIDKALDPFTMTMPDPDK